MALALRTNFGAAAGRLPASCPWTARSVRLAAPQAVVAPAVGAPAAGAPAVVALAAGAPAAVALEAVVPAAGALEAGALEGVATEVGATQAGKAAVAAAVELAVQSAAVQLMEMARLTSFQAWEGQGRPVTCLSS